MDLNYLKNKYLFTKLELKMTNKYEVHSFDMNSNPPTPNIHSFVFAEDENQALEKSRADLSPLFNNLQMSHAILIEENITQEENDAKARMEQGNAPVQQLPTDAIEGEFSIA
jgi:hypothetical protein